MISFAEKKTKFERLGYDIYNWPVIRINLVSFLSDIYKRF